jgi:hypothetical protein
VTAINVQVLERMLDEVLADNPAKSDNGRRAVEWTVWAMRARIQAAAAVTAPRPAPVVRASDPWTSQLGALQIEPSRGTKQAKVLRALRAAEGGWVDGEELTAPDVGGAEGLRRCRELRTERGWPIDRRPHPGGGRRFQYRLDLSSIAA